MVVNMPSRSFTHLLYIVEELYCNEGILKMPLYKLFTFIYLFSIHNEWNYSTHMRVLNIVWRIEKWKPTQQTL